MFRQLSRNSSRTSDDIMSNMELGIQRKNSQEEDANRATSNNHQAQNDIEANIFPTTNRYFFKGKVHPDGGSSVRVDSASNGRRLSSASKSSRNKIHPDSSSLNTDIVNSNDPKNDNYVVNTAEYIRQREPVTISRPSSRSNGQSFVRPRSSHYVVNKTNIIMPPLEYQDNISSFDEETSMIREEIRQREVQHANILQAALEYIHKEAAEDGENAVAVAILNTESEERAQADHVLEALRVELMDVLLSEEKDTYQKAIAVAIEDEKKTSDALLAEDMEQQDKFLEAQAQAALGRQQRLHEGSFGRILDEDKSRGEAVREEKLLSSRLKLDGMQESLHAFEDKFQKRLAAAVVKSEQRIRNENDVLVRQLKVKMDGLVHRAEMERNEFQSRYLKEHQTRKQVQAKLLDFLGNVRVYCRVRPVLEYERSSGDSPDALEFPFDGEIVVKSDHRVKSSFEFDQVFAPNSQQEEIFEQVKPICQSVLDGYNVCIFAYGQTGSGKTFTMEGYGSQIGVSPRVVNELFQLMENMSSEWTFEVKFSMLEIYNETIRDLLDPATGRGNARLEVVQSADGGVSVPGLSEMIIEDTSQALDIISEGHANKSAHSHVVYTLFVKGERDLDGELQVIYSKINFVEMASPNTPQTPSSSSTESPKEPNHLMNASITAVGDVVASIVAKRGNIPYQNSILTYYLKDSLNLKSKIHVIANVTPLAKDVEETASTLTFASRCKNGIIAKKTESSKAGHADTVSVNVGALQSSPSTTILGFPSKLKSMPSSNSLLLTSNPTLGAAISSTNLHSSVSRKMNSRKF